MKKWMTALIFLTLVFCAFGCGAEPAPLQPSVEPPPAQNSKSEDSNFVMNLYSDYPVYKTTDSIKIWATLKYIGSGDSVRIWHGEPYVTFSITDGKDFHVDPVVLTIQTSTVLEKNMLQYFNYEKSGAWDADDPNADFWEKFYEEKELFLPAGQYTITAKGAFSLSEDAQEDSGLTCTLTITVEV